jgi:hypothetical protein
MKNKLSGAILISAAGLTAVIGLIGARIANAIVLAGFYAGSMTGVNPPGPDEARLPGLALASVIILGVLGLYFLFKPASE